MITQKELVLKIKRYARINEVQLRRNVHLLMTVLSNEDLLKLYNIARNRTLYGIEKKSRELLKARGVHIED